MGRCKVCWTSAAVLGLLSTALVTRFMVVGAVEPSADGRTAIVVATVEREQVLGEMRGLLEAVQKIVVANNAGDLSAVAVAARVVGRAAMQPQSAEFSAKLPMDFRKLGLDTHVRFDQLAADAERFESTEQVSQQLGELLDNCVSCHAVYRLEEVDAE